jgi:uncharacterized protein
LSKKTQHEVDFVIQAGRRVTAIEVKSNRTPDARPGLEAFSAAFRPGRSLLVGGDGIALEEFLSQPVSGWTRRNAILSSSPPRSPARDRH